MKSEHEHWLEDQAYEEACRYLAVKLRDIAELPRMQRMKLRADVLELAVKLEDERAHVVAVWD